MCSQRSSCMLFPQGASNRGGVVAKLLVSPLVAPCSSVTHSATHCFYWPIKSFYKICTQIGLTSVLTGTHKGRGVLFRRIVVGLFWTLWTLLLIGTTAWGAAALWFDGPTARWAAGTLAVLYGVLCITLQVFVWRSPRWRLTACHYP